MVADYAKDDGRQAINFTALRLAERTYKRFKTTAQLLASKDIPGACIIDFQDQSDVRIHWSPNGTCTVPLIPGLIIIPSALSLHEQVSLITSCISDYTRPPNQSSLDPHYEIPEQGLFGLLSDIYSKEKSNIYITKKSNPSTNDPPVNCALDESGIIALIRRQRWTTLGIHYDWTDKTYVLDTPSYLLVPQKLKNWSESFMQERLGFTGWRAEGGIMNFYEPGDSLTGHVDRSELNRAAPLLSISLGAPCVFLIGGHSREDPVNALLLRSGDVLVMTGHARDCFHGVPTILKDAVSFQDLVDQINSKKSYSDSHYSWLSSSQFKKVETGHEHKVQSKSSDINFDKHSQCIMANSRGSCRHRVYETDQTQPQSNKDDSYLTIECQCREDSTPRPMEAKSESKTNPSELDNSIKKPAPLNEGFFITESNFEKNSKLALRILGDCRININLRQVF